MKHIIIESGDNLGKDTLIRGISQYFDNVTIRHFGKPPKDLLIDEILDFQFNTFNKEALFVNEIRKLEDDKYKYYDNIVIWNRSHLGEFVYSQMFRGVMSHHITNKLKAFEQNAFSESDDVYLVSLTSAPQFFLDNEDGKSFSKTLKEKTKELSLFKKIHNISIIKNKKMFKVDNLKGFKNKDLILGEVLEFLNIGLEKI